jgi:lysocardiolipin and lysophospholipid acyltransferase
MDCIPTSEDKISTWLMDRFRFKDQLLYNFQFQGQFPDQAKESDLPTVKSSINCVIVITLTGLCMYCIFSSVWFKIYVSVVCAYLVPATYFNIRPQPILGLFKM